MLQRDHIDLEGGLEERPRLSGSRKGEKGGEGSKTQRRKARRVPTGKKQKSCASG